MIIEVRPKDHLIIAANHIVHADVLVICTLRARNQFVDSMAIGGSF